MLTRLCQVDSNDEVLSENLEARLYEDIVAMLTVHDIQLIVHTLEALYQLSELGCIPCTRISEITSAIGQYHLMYSVISDSAINFI